MTYPKHMIGELPSQCSLRGCGNTPTHRAEFSAWAMGRKRKHAPAMGYLPIVACDEHAESHDPSDVLTGETMGMIQSAFFNMGKAIPDRDSIEVCWVPLAGDADTDGAPN